MKKLVENFTRQLIEAKAISEKAVLEKKSGIQSVLITGLGGSGIGGTVLGELVAKSCPVPILVNKDYFLPEFVNAHTLVIVSSYSGNTEETLSAMQDAIQRGAQIVCVTSGGRILELAKQHQFGFIEIPGGQPPRSCLGYSLIQLIKVLEVYGFADASLYQDLDKAIALLEKESLAIQKEAKEIAEKLHKKFPILYSLGSCEG
ncbi:MAG: bifunctional phosphoglucose/phosphomannose isomerase, partial [Sphingobacteriia bacterium]|nr:bifunctional phosphoglucose/phosphomannose isomerase [Sphingobacteriia bacterium]